MSKPLFVINPAGHGGTGLKAWEAFKARWPDTIDDADVVFTEYPGHSREVAASCDGYDTLAAVGGDGTVGEVISGMMDRGDSSLQLGIVPAGTGNDIARNAGIQSIDDSLAALRRGRAKAFDLMRVDSRIDDQPATTYGFLAAAIGFSCIPMIRPWMKRLLGPAGAYYLATMLQVILYRPTHLSMRAEDREYSGASWLILIGNVESTAGGSMRLAPGARGDDGLLHVSTFPWGSRFGMASSLMPKIASGEHVHDPRVSYFPSTRAEIASDPPALVEVDGDLFGTTPATITVLPRSIRILTPSGGSDDVH